MTTGLYRGATEESFTTLETIKKEARLRGESTPPVFVTPTKTPGKDFPYWSTRLKERSDTYMETAEKPKTAEIRFNAPPLVTFQADQHVGGAYTDYARIEAEAEAIVSTPDSYVFLVGDLVDAFFFNPAQFEELEQVPEQIEYARALVRYYADAGKLLGVWNGNHDAWVKKHGFDPYTYILEGIDTNYFHGVGYVKMHLGEHTYNLTGNHVMKGSSIYNNNHPQRRALNEYARGSDIVVSGHWHTKAIQQAPFTEFGGDGRVTTMIALGTYKATDEYIRTYGFANRDPMSMYGASIELGMDSKRVTTHYDVLQAHEDFLRR